MNTTYKKLINASINLFNSIPIEFLSLGGEQNCSKKLIEYGFFINCETIPIEIQELLIEQSFEINKSFYKCWNDILSKNRNKLLLDQIFHYITVWMKDNGDRDTVYVPNTNTTQQKFNIPLRIIKLLSLDQIKNKAKCLLYTNVALKEETINDIFNIVDYKDIKLSAIKNRDSNILLHTKLHIIPKSAVEILKCLVYEITGNLQFVKNQELFEQLKTDVNSSNNGSKALFWIKNNEILLAQIFNRFKPIFLSLKNEKLSPYINKISHLSKKYHVPCKNLQNESNLTGFQIARHLKYLKQKQPRSFVVRNGKIWCEREKALKIKEYENKIKTLLNGYSLKSSNFTKIALPISEKKFIGNYPMGSEFICSDGLIIGIYWKNNNKRVDLDLSCKNLEGKKIGWDSDFYNNKKDVIFSGDVTDASNGANEYLTFSSDTSPKLVQVNYFNFDSNLNEVEFEIIVAKNNITKQITRSTILNPDEIIATMKTTINCKKPKTLGVVYPGGRFVVIDKYIGEKTQTNGINNVDLQIIINSFNHNLFFDDFLTPEQDNEDKDVLDLRNEHISKDTLLNLFTKSS